MTSIGTVETLMRYPVKSMRGESLDAVHVAYTGITGDRVWAFVDPDKKPSFPWHSAREQHDLLLYQPRFRAAPALDQQYPTEDRFDVDVTTPDGETFALRDPKLLDGLRRKSGRPFILRFSEKGMQDARPISIFGLGTVTGLSAEAERPLDPLRFRANVYVRWTDPTPFFEDTLVGRQLRIGDKLEVLIAKKDPRCVIITLDPATAEAHPEVLRTVAKNHKGCAGVYAVVVKEGVVKRGDAVELL
jgi:uncharacterized protein YcbX